MLMENRTFAKRSTRCCVLDCTSHIKEKFLSFTQMLQRFLVAMLLLVTHVVWMDPMNNAITEKKKKETFVPARQLSL
jgi:hypothetical protein